MQGPPTYGAEPNGLPLSEKLLPEYLRELGYTTRAIGKWHLGFYKQAYTPTRRGFDSHFGYYTGFVSYYDYILQDVVSRISSFPYRLFDVYIQGCEFVCDSVIFSY